ncbi:hypothetical protein MTR62_02995 [Novosphingobium sp. 1949]|uniref:Elongation factor P n=1 Tax=Novosphingobium organovorum TaxID=2930092 RepID=A0ABT0BA52_9SPHN|nr:hypothetical protein [Novosphingobium organovorum]MCJ2181679.1 hypothetical protein [Novosphingobium organovorum]
MIRTLEPVHSLSRPAFALAALLALAALVPGTVEAAVAEPAPPPVPGGRIDTLSLGRYTCEKPGDAGGLIGEPMPAYNFSIVNASSYKAGGVRGSYLLTGDDVVMTGGKLQNMRFKRVSSGFLRLADPATPADAMRCVLAGRK